MEKETRDKFLRLWNEFFPGAELPVTFQYAGTSLGVPVGGPPSGHRCILAQLIKARHGESICMREQTVTCLGGKRYTNFSGTMPVNFECYISHYPDGRGERYKRFPGQVSAFWDNLPQLPVKGDYLVVKRWDLLEEADEPQGVIFFATPDVLSGLFTLACFDSTAEDAVIAPFGAGCTSIIYFPYREELNGTGRCVIGLMDPSARKVTASGLINFAAPITKFLAMVDQMEESFLVTDTWTIIRKRIENSKLEEMTDKR